MTLTLTKNERILGWIFLICEFLVVPFAVSLACVLVGITSETVINQVCFFLNAALAVVLFRRLLEQSLRNCAGRWGETLLTALLGLGMYWAVNLAMTYATVLVEPEFANVNDESIRTMLQQSPLLMPLAVIFAAPLAEECLFRGWIFTGLAKKSMPLAYLVTCGLFSAAHVVSYIGIYGPKTLLLCFIQYLGPSLILCRVCQKNDSLAAPILLHMAVNAMGCLIIG